MSRKFISVPCLLPSTLNTTQWPELPTDNWLRIRRYKGLTKRVSAVFVCVHYHSDPGHHIS